MEESFYINLNEMVEQLKQKSIKGGLTWDKRGLVFYPSLSEIGGKKKWFLPTSIEFFVDLFEIHPGLHLAPTKSPA